MMTSSGIIILQPRSILTVYCMYTSFKRGPRGGNRMDNSDHCCKCNGSRGEEVQKKIVIIMIAFFFLY